MAAIAPGLRTALQDRYRLEGELGQGGMATVYLAHDLRNNRKVALKVLRPELAAMLGGERFLKEIETTANLQHPHILPLFDSGEAESFLFYVMPYVEGESLRDQLNREKQLPIPDAVRIASEVASALDYAHRHGVLHRDIKPENILLQDGQAVVADFGIARALQGDRARLTETGIAIGTPAYMSPEQASGERQLDARSDICSLGAVLYEMLSGEPPFSGPTAQAIIAKRLSTTPPSLRILRPEVPEPIDVAVLRSLARVPADRFSSGAEFAAALAASAGAPSTSGTRRIAPERNALGTRLPAAALITVLLLAASALGYRYLHRPRAPIESSTIVALPFRAADPALAEYREGLVDLFASALDGAGGLRAIGARTSLKRWHAEVGNEGEGDDAAVDRVAGSLGAHYVLTGEMIPLGTGIKLRVHVHDLARDSTYAAEADGSPDSIAVLAQRAGTELLRHIAGPAARLVTGGPFATRSLEALKAYLAGEKAFREARYPGAIAAFDRAIAADSTFALAQFRRGAAVGWTKSPHDPGGVRSSVLAGLPRLGRHDSLLVRGSWELGKTLHAALSSFETLTREYPEDAEGWYLLGDAYYHIGMLHGITPARVDSALRRAIALDSTFAPAYLHLIEDAFQRTDSAESGILIRALVRFDSLSPKTTGLRLAWTLAFGTESERQRAKERLPTLEADALLPAKHAMNLNPDLAEWTELVGRSIYANPRNGYYPRGQGIGGAGESFELRGRFTESWPLLIRAQALFDSSADPSRVFWPDLGPALYRLEGLPAYAGWDTRPSPESLPSYDPFHSPDPRQLYFVGTWGIARGRWKLVDRALGALRHMADTLIGGSSLPDSMNRAEDRALAHHLAVQLDSWRQWTEHPTEASLHRFAEATDSLRIYDGWLPVIADYILGKAYLAQGDLAAAERHLVAPQRWNSGVISELIVPREYYLGRIAEERGHRAEAREHYARFVRWWRDCDPELKPMWEDGRQRLASVSGEPREP